jgi:hypothetical protein
LNNNSKFLINLLKSTDMILRNLLSAAVLVTIFQYSSCKSGGDDPVPATEIEKVSKLLIGDGTVGTTWTVSTVTVDGIDYSEVFTGFTLTFSEAGFNSTNGTVVFDVSDSWTLNDTATKLTAGNGLELTITELTDNKFVFSFLWDETVFGGRSNAVGGENIFTMSR